MFAGAAAGECWDQAQPAAQAQLSLAAEIQAWQELSLPELAISLVALELSACHHPQAGLLVLGTPLEKAAGCLSSSTRHGVQ